MDDRKHLQRDAAGIGALADPVRHRLYQFVCDQPAPVTRDQAADAVGIPTTRPSSTWTGSPPRACWKPVSRA